MSGNAARMADAEFAKQAFERLVEPALQVIQKEAISELIKLGGSPTSTAGREAMANFARTTQILDQLHSLFLSQIADGAVARQDKRLRDQIAEIRPERRKILGIG